MITLITGTPGTGKTAYVVSELEKTTGRNIYVDGIPELTLPHEIAPPVSEWVNVNTDAGGAISHEWKIPANSIVIIDEAQRTFRPRPSGSKVPDYVAALETHRHAGLDFWFITQHPGLLDVNIRRLCGRHIHVRNTPIGRRLHESTQVFDPENKFERDATVTRPFKLPKQVFSKYRSAEVHTKSGKRMPLSFYVLIIAFILAIGVSFYVYQSIQSKLKSEKKQDESVLSKSSPSGQQLSLDQPDPLDPATRLLEFVPVVPGRPETAPAYVAIAVVKRFPYVAGCIDFAKHCKCLTQTGENAGLDNMQCRQWIANPPFNPYIDESVQSVSGPREPSNAQNLQPPPVQRQMVDKVNS